MKFSNKNTYLLSLLAVISGFTSAGELENKIEELGRNVGSKNYKEKYLELMGFLSDHTTVVSGLVIPFLPYLSSFLPT
mgnify:CR=1 FL=1